MGFLEMVKTEKLLRLIRKISSINTLISDFFSMGFIIIFIISSTISLYSNTPVRLKDIAFIDGLKENQLTGIGLVTGLRGQGDSPQFELTRKMLLNFASNFGFNITESDVKSKNAAAVVVSANIDAFTRVGDSVSVTVSSIGDAKSLEGGILLLTALKAPNGNVYAVSQGRIIAGSKSTNTENTGTIPGGAIVERSVIADYITNNTIRVVLKTPDFTTSNLIKEAIEGLNPQFQVSALDPGVVQVVLDEESLRNPVNAVSQIELLTVTPDFKNAVVIDRKTGVIISGAGVVIRECTISTGSLTVTVSNNNRNNRSNTARNSMKIAASTVDELVSVLNQAGIPVNEITSLLEAIHRTGALNAKLIIL